MPPIIHPKAIARPSAVSTCLSSQPPVTIVEATHHVASQTPPEEMPRQQGQPESDPQEFEQFPRQQRLERRQEARALALSHCDPHP
jgi:hypothetical protein